jgi:hypothetical protein
MYSGGEEKVGLHAEAGDEDVVEFTLRGKVKKEKLKAIVKALVSKGDGEEEEEEDKDTEKEPEAA